MNKSILIVEDDAISRQFLVDIFFDHFKGVNIVTAVDGEDAISKIEHAPPTVLVLDMIMPRKTGYDVLKELADRKHNSPVIIQSGYVTKSNFRHNAPIPQSPLVFFPKPFDVRDMIQVLELFLNDPKS